MIGGPFLPRDKKDELAARARDCNIQFYEFYKKIEKQFAMADLVVSMGGYNTVCEILSLHKPCLIIPRETPRQEQFIRAQVLFDRGLIDYLPWSELHPDALYEKIAAMLENPEPYVQAMRAFPMTGLEIMRSRLTQFRKD